MVKTNSHETCWSPYRSAVVIHPDTYRVARGTQDLGVRVGSAMAEHQVAMALHGREQLRTLGRNIETAAGLAFAYRLGRAHDAFEALGRKSDSWTRGDR